MIQTPHLNQQDILQLQNKIVIIAGSSKNSKMAFAILRHFNIKVIAFYDDSSAKKRCCGIPIINDNVLSLYVDEKKDVVVLPVKNEVRVENLQNQFFHSLTVENICRSFSTFLYLQKLKNPILYRANKLLWKLNCMRRYNIEYIAMNLRKPSVPLLICLPMKTADHTLYHTFDGVNSSNAFECRWFNVDTNRHTPTLVYKLKKSLYYFLDALLASKEIDYANLIHKPRIVKRKNLNRRFNAVKIVTATREPVSQNLSVLFQEIPLMDSLKSWALNDLCHASREDRKSCVDMWQARYLEKGNDVQEWFDLYIEQYLFRNHKTTFIPREGFIQCFMSEFEQYVLDITSYPFDKEKGYTIIREGKFEIFVYQLEKLNSLVPELSDFIGASFDNLLNANQANDKWIAESYKQAQKEIEITQEYFDKCFDEPYVKHCYSEADIDKFKARWRPHIKKEH